MRKTAAGLGLSLVIVFGCTQTVETVGVEPGLEPEVFPGDVTGVDVAIVCNRNGLCEADETPLCIDCQIVTCDFDGICQPRETLSCADCASGGCFANGICDAGEPQSCADCAVDVCVNDGVCRPGEDATCPDCTTVGCNGDGVCQVGESKACVDCTTPSACNLNQLCEFGESAFFCPDCR